MIVDTSVWIAHLRGVVTPETRRLKAALERREPLPLPDVILMELLQGAAGPNELLRLERAFHTLPRFVPADGRALALEAARLYARCRWSGFTPAGRNDCLIACCAIEAGQALLHQDRDFVRIARVAPTLRLAES